MIEEPFQGGAYYENNSCYNRKSNGDHRVCSKDEQEKLIKEKFTEEEVKELLKEGFTMEQIAYVAKDKIKGDKQCRIIGIIFDILTWFIPDFK